MNGQINDYEMLLIKIGNIIYVTSPLWVFLYITSCIFHYNPIARFPVYRYPQFPGKKSEAGSLSILPRLQS